MDLDHASLIEAELPETIRVNAPRPIALACLLHRVYLIHISTPDPFGLHGLRLRFLPPSLSGVATCCEPR